MVLLYGRLSDRRFLPLLAVIGAVALALRVGYLLIVRDDPLASDGWYHHNGALLWADGHGWVNPAGLIMKTPLVQDAHHPPMWRLTLGLLSMGGIRSQLSHQLAAALIGTATVIVMGLTGRRVAGARTGLLAAALAAVYPGFWTFERELLTEVLMLLGLAVVLLLSYRFIDQPSTGLAIALGAVVGLLALTRSEQSLLVVLLVGPVLLSARAVALRRRVAWAALATLVACLVVLPWPLYNHDRFKEPVVLSTGLGYAMAVSNCDAGYSGKLLGYFDFDCGWHSSGLWRADPSVGDLEMRSSAWRFATGNLDRLPLVLAARLGRTMSLFRQGQEVRLYQRWIGTRPVVIWSWLIGFWMMVPFALIGIRAMWRRGRPLYPLVAPVVTVLIITVLTFGQPRYRAAADVSLVLLAAVGIDWLWRRFAGEDQQETRRRWGGRDRGQDRAEAVAQPS